MRILTVLAAVLLAAACSSDAPNPFEPVPETGIPVPKAIEVEPVIEPVIEVPEVIEVEPVTEAIEVEPVAEAIWLPDPVVIDAPVVSTTEVTVTEEWRASPGGLPQPFTVLRFTLLIDPVVQTAQYSLIEDGALVTWGVDNGDEILFEYPSAVESFDVDIYLGELQIEACEAACFLTDTFEVIL